MDVWFLGPDGLTEHGVDEAATLLARADGFMWVDIPELTADAEEFLKRELRIHPLALRACTERNFVPTVHRYDENVLVVLHTPLAGEGGHVHLLELDQLISERYLVTVHGPRNPVVPLREATAETNRVRARIAEGRFRPRSPTELSHAVVSSVARRQNAAVRDVANRLPALELRVMSSNFHKPEELLDELFLLRHELLIARTMAAQSYDIYARLASLDRTTSEEAHGYAVDLREQFERARNVADGESQFLFGVIELYQTRVTTKMTVAMERLAVIAAITLPVTALASVYGMNVIVNNRTHVPQLLIVLVVMAAISGWLLTWTRRQGWW